MKIGGQDVPPSILALARTCDYEEGHSHQVTFLAIRLFDTLQYLHKLPESARKLLIAAGMLHDIGLSRGVKGHHKSTYDIIVQRPLTGFDKQELEIVALTARYHRKTPPAIEHDAFARLSVDEQGLVRTLAAILRVADGLDRGHASVVMDVDCQVDDETLAIQLRTNGPAELEIWGAERKADLMREVFGREVIIR